MRDDLFYPGDTVITIVDYGGIPSGAVGKIVNRWRGTTYVVKLPDGTYGWVDSSDFISVAGNTHDLRVGEKGVVISDKNHHGFAKVGDVLPVVKIVDNMDYYTVSFGDSLKWISGFQLAKYI